MSSRTKTMSMAQIRKTALWSAKLTTYWKFYPVYSDMFPGPYPKINTIFFLTFYIIKTISIQNLVKILTSKQHQRYIFPFSSTKTTPTIYFPPFYLCILKSIILSDLDLSNLHIMFLPQHDRQIVLS